MGSRSALNHHPTICTTSSCPLHYTLSGIKLVTGSAATMEVLQGLETRLAIWWFSPLVNQSTATTNLIRAKIHFPHRPQYKNMTHSTLIWNVINMLSLLLCPTLSWLAVFWCVCKWRCPGSVWIELNRSCELQRLDKKRHNFACATGPLLWKSKTFGGYALGEQLHCNKKVTILDSEGKAPTN